LACLAARLSQKFLCTAHSTFYIIIPENFECLLITNENSHIITAVWSDDFWKVIALFSSNSLCAQIYVALPRGCVNYLPLTGMVICGSFISPFCHLIISISAALSAWMLQLRKGWFGLKLKLKFLQNLSPLQPSLHGSTTERKKLSYLLL